MPQMMPINWILSLTFFIIIFIIFNIMNYYIYYNLNNMKNKSINTKFKNNLIWKW
uniref:ATP synthase complex subunit 8 n=1 Tax=Theretra japonica TaxID=644662 RepID=A0A343VZ01_9NEOP|nr:ATP synthase F0 subunit 8 [Theretra japonica]AVR43439.1 ATP synthase F0 subunit 8 [Theretra japonica]UMR55031.1 ATP synthase F0 subunit 8 [Theretra japonica]